MGESKNDGLKLGFDGHLGLEFSCAKAISHARRTFFQIYTLHPLIAIRERLLRLVASW